jgi:hypothetical protein
MATTVSAFLTETSNELDDASKIVWADSASLIPFARDGVRLIRSRRADSRFDDYGNYIDDPDADVTAGGNVPLPDPFVSRLKIYVLARCYARDSADARDVSRSSQYMGQFDREIVL